MSQLTITMPIQIIVDGESIFSRHLFFASHNVDGYRQRLTKEMQELYVLLNKPHSDVWHHTLTLIRKQLIFISEFWLNNIFKPLNEKITLPSQEVCTCNRISKICHRNLFHHAFYTENGERWRVDLSNGDMIVQYNCDRQIPEDICQILSFYEQCVLNDYSFPLKSCCPASTTLIKILEILVNTTQDVLKDMKMLPECEYALFGS